MPSICKIVNYGVLKREVDQGTAADIVLMYARGTVLRDPSKKIVALRDQCALLVATGPPELTQREAASMRATLASYFLPIAKNAQTDRPTAHYNMMV